MQKYHALKFLLVFLFSFSFASLNAYDNYQVQLMTIVKNNEATVNSLTQQMSHLQDKCSSLELQVNQLKQALTSVKQNSSQVQSDMAALKQQTGEDKAQIQKTLNTAVDRIANETSKAISSAVKASNSAQAVATPGGTTTTAPSDKFYVYKVQEGATLTTIAKAYKVSVDSIKKANKLKNHTLSTGQVLYIPKK